jgi:hypothetical protein
VKTPPIDDVLRNLRAARLRLGLQAFLDALVKMGLLAGAVLLLAGAANRWLLDRLPFDPRMAGMVVAAAGFVAVLIALARRRSLVQVAGIIDRLGATRDRFLTALSFSREPKDEEMRGFAVQECVRFVQGGRFGQLIRVRVPRQAVYLLVPIIGLAMLQWEARQTFAAREADAEAGRAAVEDTAKKLEQLAKQALAANEEAKSEELKKIAEQLKRSAEELRANAKNADEGAKSALRELSALEEMIKEMQKSPGAMTPEEMKELAKALEQQDATKDAAKEMNKGDLAKAAEELEKAMQKLADQKDEQTPEEIKKALEDAMKRLAEQKQLSEAMQKFQQQLQRMAAQKGGDSNEAAKQLADMLRKMAQGKSGQSKGSQQGATAMQNLMSALQNMKFGEGQGEGENEPGKGKDGNSIVIQNFNKDGQPGLQMPGDPTQPSGQPGSEKDTGTTDTPFGKDKNAAAKEGKEQQLTGRMGEGESLQQALTSAGDQSKSKRGYKDLYEAMAPAAQDAVLQENIPLGSRFFIKRYFEAIRPKE